MYKGVLQLSNAECKVNFRAIINSSSCRNSERSSLQIYHWTHGERERERGRGGSMCVCVCARARVRTHTHTHLFAVPVAIVHVKCKEELL